MDPAAAQPLTTIAFKMAAFDWKWRESELAFRDAIVSNPGYATARHWYGFFCLTPQRRVKAAIEELTRACALDPLSPAIGTHLGCVLYFRRSYREAVDQHLRAIELDPSFHLAYWHLAFSYTQLSLFDEANAALNQAKDLGCGESSYLAAFGYLQAAAGNTQESERQLAALRRLAEKSYVSPVSVALVHAALNDRDSAFQWLDLAMRERSSRLIHIKVEPAFDKLKTDPRFISVLSTLDLL
jgi:tetratricopeptide (TPR) repeat protein